MTIGTSASGYTVKEDNEFFGASWTYDFAVGNDVRVRSREAHHTDSDSCEYGAPREVASAGLAVGDAWTYDTACGPQRFTGADSVSTYSTVLVDGESVDVAHVTRRFQIDTNGFIESVEMTELISLEHRILIERHEVRTRQSDGNVQDQLIRLRSLRQQA